MMKTAFYIHFALLLMSGKLCFSQTLPFKENAKWGIKENESVIIQPIYDTIFNFDSTGKVCLACHRSKSSSTNKFIKVTTTSYACNYLNKKNERLIIRNTVNDTFSVFSYNKNLLKLYAGSEPFFTVSAKGKKHLLYKNFQQITFKGYHDVRLSDDPKFYNTWMMNEADVIVAGLTNEREEEVIPHIYSYVEMNTQDSLIIACSSGVRKNAEDDVYNYEGKKITSSLRHIELATKNFLIQKVFEPKEYYVIYNVTTKEETKLKADETKLYQENEILIRQKKSWYVYNLLTHEKKPYKPS